ncbi:MAG: hypothetical protein ABEJ88_06055 [Halobacterium sp.]
MSERPARTAVVAALSDWRRHALALATVAAAADVPGAYYGAALVAFTVWMAWFVATTIGFIRHADF